MIDTALGVGVVGAGIWGRHLVRVLSDLSSCQLLAVCDLDEKVRARVKQQFPTTSAFAELEEMLSVPGLDAVVIATPAPSHFRLARMALMAGKHTCVEKPLALTVREASELVELAETNHLKLMVGHLLLYHRAVEWMHQRLDAGDFGDIYYLYSTRINLGLVRSDENALWSLAPHDISVILYLLGALPTSVCTHGECYLQPGVEDVVFLTMHFPGRKMAHVHVSWLAPHKVRQITMVGTKRMVVFNDTHPTEKLRVFDRGVDIRPDFKDYAQWLTLRSGDLHVPAIPLDEPLRRECEHFVSCVLEDRTPRSDGKSGLQVVRILEAASRSLENGTLEQLGNTDQTISS